MSNYNRFAVTFLGRNTWLLWHAGCSYKVSDILVAAAVLGISSNSKLLTGLYELLDRPVTYQYTLLLTNNKGVKQ